MPLNRKNRRVLLSTTPDAAATWMRTQLALSLRELEQRFAGAQITIIVSAPDAAAVAADDKPPFSHVTSCPADDLRAVLSQLLKETANG